MTTPTKKTEENQAVFQSSPPAARMFYPHLYRPRAFVDPRTNKASGDPKFDAMFSWPNGHRDVAAMRKLITDVARQAFPAEFAQVQAAIKAGVAFDRIIQFPMKSGDKMKPSDPKYNNDHLLGMTVITARSLFPPELSVLRGREIVVYSDEDKAAVEKSHFYPGVEVLVEITFMPWQVGSNTPTVTAYLNKVMSLGRGERLGGARSTATDVWAKHIGEISSADPTVAVQENDDEIPF